MYVGKDTAVVDNAAMPAAGVVGAGAAAMAVAVDVAEVVDAGGGAVVIGEVGRVNVSSIG